MRRIGLLVVGMILLPSISAIAQQAEDQLVVHEWGTFTSLQDEIGRSLGAIAADSEPLPAFVHSLDNSLFTKGIPANVVDAESLTMRLETPVVYFYPPRDSGPMHVDFSAAFHGGLLTQFYPNAESNFPIGASSVKVDGKTLGTLRWKDLIVGQPAPGPATDSRVWLAPRKVNAADITAAGGGSERYLFYRGVAQIDAPLKVVRFDGNLRISGDPEVRQIWYLDVRDDRRCAWRKINTDEQEKPGFSTPASFGDADYAAGNFTALRAEMKPALVSAGLFEDEADAMLDTWEESYFKSPGVRLLFIVPRAWVNEKLPITLSVPARIERVMVGRIDLVTPRQRELLAEYLRTDPSQTKQRDELLKQMGRFGPSIVQDELKRRRTPTAMAAPVSVPLTSENLNANPIGWPIDER